MMMTSGSNLVRAVVTAAIAMVVGASSTAASATISDPLQTHACVTGKTQTPSLCGTFRVYENRQAASGRTIDIHFVVLKANKPTDRAIFFNPGGPGAGATQFAGYIADGVFEKFLPRLRDSYNIVFVDNRGSGLSHPLQCDFFSAAKPQTYFLQIWPDAQLKACRAKLVQDADLSFYADDFAADDLDDLRAALGYPKIVLSGTSGGTTFFLDFARRHPSHVESVVLEGVAPPHLLIIPLQDAQGGQLTIDHIATDCEHDAGCRAHFPHFRAHFAAIVERLEHGPITIEVENTTTHKLEKVQLSKQVFGDRLRQALYSNASAAYVPYVIDQAYAGNGVPLGTMIEASADGLNSIISEGDNLSVTCAEDIPFITEADIAQTSVGSFIGDSRVRAQQHACKIWNVRPVPAAFQDPVRSTAPVFMISGTDDPTTPPQYATEELAYLPNGKQLLIANASHDTEVDCADALAERFVRQQSVKDLDTRSCAAQYHRPAFATSMSGFGD
ncbi:MAG TPA: alpha/beta fold hydrolase [Candidatus Eremiobacteraceae bacterium]|nr:alpha/beta fold hydrolase [Candidatus Eremiobacteraceae bacterium]